MTDCPFPFVVLPRARSAEKPRRAGLTMMIDWGLGPKRLDDTLDLAGDYVDLGKIAVGTPRLYPEAMLRRKFEIYRSHRVRAFLGGMFIEHHLAAAGMDAMPRFYEESRRVGFEIVEVSDNLRPFTSNERRHLVRLAIEEGLAVFGEVGSKLDVTDPADLVRAAEECLEAGCEIVLIEGAELVDAEGRAKRDLLGAIARHLDLDRILFELPGPWISGTRNCDVHDLKKLLVREFGPDVNVGNVMPDEVMETEALRNGLSVIALEEGAGHLPSASV